MKIAISGESGSGNTTISHILAGKLGLKCINYTFRDMARDEGIAFEKLHKMAQQDPKWDRKLDNYLIQLSQKDCVLASRLAIWLLTDADFKFYLDAKIEVRAERISKRESISFSKSLENTKKRDEANRSRYFNIYGIHYDRHPPKTILLDANFDSTSFIVDKMMEIIQKTY